MLRIVRWNVGPVLAVLAVGAASFGISAAAQGPGPAQAPGATPALGPPPPRFPAQLRPPDDPELVARGRRVYDISCRACHGADLRGGDMGGPNLLRSQVALNDQRGELLLPVLQGGRPSMPAVALQPDDVAAVAAYVHSVLAKGRAQGAPPATPPVQLDVLVGDRAAGETYFKAKCSSCHSATGDLSGIASRIPDPVQLQNLWVAGESTEPRDPNRPFSDRDVMVVVSLPSGSRVEGRLDRIDDFSLTVLQRDGARRTIARDKDVPKVEIRDPLAVHKQMLSSYTDRDIHDVTAYLVTLK
jgi:cytochrome c oxidase cbb3-type subunit III